MNPRPLFRRKLTRRSLRKSVTVCIAAIAEYEDLVTVTDKKLSKGFYSSEDASIKRQSLTSDWATMLSGKIEQFQGFLPVFYQLLGKSSRRELMILSNTDYCLSKVRSAVGRRENSRQLRS